MILSTLKLGLLNYKHNKLFPYIETFELQKSRITQTFYYVPSLYLFYKPVHFPNPITKITNLTSGNSCKYYIVYALISE